MAEFNPYMQYANVSANTQDPAMLVITLYNATIRALKGAQQAIRDNDFEARTRHFDLAFEATCELRKSLDPSHDSEFVARMDALYQFFTNEILQANVTSDINRLNPVIDMFESIRDSWKEAKEKLKDDPNANVSFER